MERLREALGGHLCRSVYLSSYTHAGRYYTLENISKFDEQGLWFYRDGTLKETTAVQVEQTPERRSRSTDDENSAPHSQRCCGSRA